MALHPDRCDCEACQEPSFCDMVAEDRQGYLDQTIPRFIPGPDSFASEVDASSFGRKARAVKAMRSMRGVTIESLTHFPTPDDPSILSMALPAFSNDAGIMIAQASSSFNDDSGIADTKSANSQTQAVRQTGSGKVATTAMSDTTKKYLIYGALAYFILRR